MIFLKNYGNKSTGARWTAWGVLGLFAAAVGFAYGIGYKMGQRAAPTPAALTSARSPGVTGRPESKSVEKAKGMISSPAAPARPYSPAEKTSMVWTHIEKTKFTLLVASFQNLPDAEKEKAKLESKGLKEIEISEKRLQGNAIWYRLSFGRFDTRELAIAYGRELTDRGIIRDFWPKEL